MGALGLLADIAAVASQLPWQASVPLALAALTQATLLARRERRRPVRLIVIPPGNSEATIDGQPMQALEVRWRGPLAFLRWRSADGRRAYLLGWPDNLSAAARRELRLAMAARVPLRTPRSMAP
ncbi:hypothetical protein GCM10027159_06300 [Lysobacter terrae]